MIASVLLTTDALPGGAQTWWAMFDNGAPVYHPENAFEALAAIPLREFPQRAHRELQAILILIPKLVQLVHRLRGEHPDWQKKQLAYEAWQIARAEFCDTDLPSVATIQRSMAEILAGRPLN